MTRIDPDALRTLMELRGMTSAQLARKVDVTHVYVMKICAGERTLSRSPVMKRRIADALGVPRRWIEVAEPGHSCPTCGQLAPARA